MICFLPEMKFEVFMYHPFGGFHLGRFLTNFKFSKSPRKKTQLSLIYHQPGPSSLLRWKVINKMPWDIYSHRWNLKFLCTTPLEASISAVSQPISNFQKAPERRRNCLWYATNRDLLAYSVKKLLIKRHLMFSPRNEKWSFYVPPLWRLLSQPLLNWFQISKRPRKKTQLSLICHQPGPSSLLS